MWGAIKAKGMKFFIAKAKQAREAKRKPVGLDWETTEELDPETEADDDAVDSKVG